MSKSVSLAIYSPSCGSWKVTMQPELALDPGPLPGRGDVVKVGSLKGVSVGIGVAVDHGLRVAVGVSVRVAGRGVLVMVEVGMEIVGMETTFSGETACG